MTNPWRRANAISRVFGALFYSAEALTNSSPSQLQSLYRRISRIRHGDLRASIPLILNSQARDLKQLELQAFIVKLRKAALYNHALHVSQWMTDDLNLDPTPGDVAARIDFISQVHGVEEAKKYFDTLRDSLRGLQAHSALLHCCAVHKSVEKAEMVFEKVKGLGFVVGSRWYNTMLRLYLQTGDHGKMDVLVKEMEEGGIDHNSETLRLCVHLYAAVSDVDRMDEVLLRMEMDPFVSVSWRAYMAASYAFFEVGEFDKSLRVLKSLEKLMSSNATKIAYHLMCSYAALGKKDEVYRIWNLYRKMGKSDIDGCRWMVIALVKLDDIEGAEKFVEEWESESNRFDFQIPILIVNAYCNKDFPDKARSYVEKLAASGKEDVSAWSLLGKGYHMNGNVAEAVEAIKKAAILPCRPGWRFSRSTMAACLQYLKDKGDVEVAHELLKFLTNKGHITDSFCGSLKKYIDCETQVLRTLEGEKENHKEVVDAILDGKTETADNGCG